MFETWYVKGVPFVNKRCMKGVPFLSKMVYKRVRGWTAGRSLPLRFFNEYSSPRVSSVFTHSGIRAYLRTKNNSNHNSRVYSGYTNDRAIVACKTGALWAKRGEGGILREARDEGRGGEKKGPVASPLFWLFPRSLYEPCVPIGWLMTRCSGMFVWNKISVTHSCSFDDAVREAFRLFPNVPEIKENHKKCLICPTEP